MGFVMNGATHKLSADFPHGLYPMYVKIEGGVPMSCLDDSCQWRIDKSIVDFISFYEEIDNLTETPEEKYIFDNWPKEMRIDVDACAK